MDFAPKNVRQLHSVAEICSFKVGDTCWRSSNLSLAQQTGGRPRRRPSALPAMLVTLVAAPAAGGRVVGMHVMTYSSVQNRTSRKIRNVRIEFETLIVSVWPKSRYAFYYTMKLKNRAGVSQNSRMVARSSYIVICIGCVSGGAKMMENHENPLVWNISVLKKMTKKYTKLVVSTKSVRNCAIPDLILVRTPTNRFWILQFFRTPLCRLFFENCVWAELRYSTKIDQKVIISALRNTHMDKKTLKLMVFEHFCL